MESSLQHLKRLRFSQEIRFLRTDRIKIPSGMVGEWRPEQIAREILFNFFRGSLYTFESVEIEIQDAAIVSSPAFCVPEDLFDVEQSRGRSFKRPEPFKIALLYAMQHYDVIPVSLNGNQAVCVRLEECSSSNLTVALDYFEGSEHCGGTRLFLLNCPAELSDALNQGKSHFFHARNPRIGKLIEQAGFVDAYYCDSDSGMIFYQDIHVAKIANIPLAFRITQSYPLFDAAMQSSSGRNTLHQQMLPSIYQVIARSLSSGAQKQVIQACRSSWIEGHPLFEEIAETCRIWHKGLWSQEDKKVVFGDRYFAASITSDSRQAFECAEFEARWQAKGMIRLPHYFSRFGLPTAREQIVSRVTI